MIISTKYLITGDGKTVLTDKAVYIGEDGKIGKIAPKEELLKEFPQEEVKEYGDATLLPGLMDMHAHLAYGYSQPDSFNYGAQLIMRRLHLKEGSPRCGICLQHMAYARI